MLKSIFVVFVFAFSLPLILHAQPEKYTWTLYSKSTTGDVFYYYDATSITKLPNGNYTLWTMVKDNPDSLVAIRKALIETRDRLKLYESPDPPIKNTLHRNRSGYYETLLYTVSKTEIDCKNGKYLHPATFDYDENNKVIGSVEDPNPKRHWLGIDPGSPTDKLKEMLCK